MAKQKLAVKATTVLKVSNMLQDLRHIIIFDFRSQDDFKQGHIRKSLNVTPEDYQERLTEAMAGPKERVHPYRSHYEGDDIKRVLFIFP